MNESPKAVFLSYAREDTDAARRIADALRAFGVEVWFDMSELRGGDSWDAKIKRQIRECALFLPIVSQKTQERTEGYFRREWLLAVERTRDMAHGVAFIVPVVIDDTREADAAVPEEFMRFHWTRLAHGVPTPQFVEQMKSLLHAPKKSAPPASDVGRDRRIPPSPAGESSPAGSGDPALQQSRRAAPLILGAIAVLAIGVAVYSFLRPAAKESTPPPKSATATKPVPVTTPPTSFKSIAVLPFINLGADKADEYLGDGMTEELLNVLAKVKGLRVPGRSSSFAFKGRTDEDIFRKVGEQLRVSTVLEGSVRKSGNRVRITAQLINVADGYHLWSETYDRDLTDILGLQSEVARQVVQALQVQLGVDEAKALEKKATANPAAHALYLKGRFHHYLFTWADSKLAVECFQQALALDPDYAMAHAGMAAIYAEMSSSWLPPTEAMPVAKRHVLRALELDDTLAEAHHSLALVRWWGDWDFAGAEVEFKRAIEMNPNDESIYANYAHYLGDLGRFEEALAAANRALDLDPQSTTDRGAVFYNQRRYDEAVADWSRQLARDPRSFTWIRFRLAAAYAMMGKRMEAIREARMARASSAEPGTADAYLACVLASAGEKAEARAMVDGILQAAKEHYISPVRIAQLYLVLGETDRAFEWLQTAYDTRSDHLLSLNVSPVWDPVRADPRFQALLKKTGLVK